MPFLINTAKKIIKGVARRFSFDSDLRQKNSPAVKINQRNLYNFYRHAISTGFRCPLADTGFRVYSQFEEDGILLYIFAAIGIEHQTFIDIGSGNGINSNCANFAVNFGWHGLFIDGNRKNIKKGVHPTKAYFVS